MFAHPWTGFATVFILGVYFWNMIRIGKARKEHNISAPEMTGPEAFNRVIRVHANMIEQMVIFLPLLWLFAITYVDIYAACVGLLFAIGRIIYSLGYYEAADKRGTGFMIGFIALMIAAVGSLYGLVMTLTS